MFTKYKFEHNHESQVWLASDTHFCHEKLVEKRGFKSVEDMNETMIRVWNERVRPQDTVLHLGDFLVGGGNDAEKKGRDILSRLNGRIGAIWGNHNSAWKQIYNQGVKTFLGDKYLKDLEVYPLNVGNVTFLGYCCLAQIRAEGKTHFVFCSHYAHRVWIDSHLGHPHVCGHFHNDDLESQSEFKNCKRLDVGYEAFQGPINFDKFIEIMNTKSVEFIGHHDKYTNPSF